MAAYALWRNYRKRVVFTENRRKMADINARLQDSLGGIRVVKSFGNEGVEMGKFAARERALRGHEGELVSVHGRVPCGELGVHGRSVRR